MARRPPVPKGAGLFGEAEPERKVIPSYQANIDGGSRGNPGPAAYGVVIRDARGDVVARLKKYIGNNTNNVAEYFGLIAALDYAQNHGIRALRIESDSELLVRQMRGHYRVRSGELRPLFERAKKMSQAFESFRINHVYREQNKEADALVNQALDETAGPNNATTTATPKATAKDATVRLLARYHDGILQPYDELELPDGTEVELLLRIRR